MKGKKTNSTLNMAKCFLFYHLGRICQQGWQLDLSSKFYLYMEFQDSKLGGVRLIGKITLPTTTSME